LFFSIVCIDVVLHDFGATAQLFASIFDIVLHEFRIGVAVVYDCCAGVLKVLFVVVDFPVKGRAG